MIMSFSKNKEDCINKMQQFDKSTKGGVDDEIKEIVDYINSLDNYYTTSSCSGKLMLIEMDENKRKKTSSWLYVSHQKTSFEEFKENLRLAKEDMRVWFVLEPMILHVCCKTIEDAQDIINAAKHCGLKRSGIFTTKNKYLVEIMGCEHLETPISTENKILVDDDYIKTLVECANEKMQRKEKINEKFLKNFKDLIKN